MVVCQLFKTGGVRIIVGEELSTKVVEIQRKSD